MQTEEDFYYAIIEDFRNMQLLNMVGTRDTVIECALRVILDSAPDWKESNSWPRPHFRFTVTKIKK